MAVTLRDLADRRVPQYFAIYLGAGWGLVEFASFIEERYALSPAWTDVLLIVWAVLIPSVLLYAWTHGRPGRDRATRLEAVFIPLNILLAVAVGFGGRDLSATTTRIMVTDENGETAERVVARAEHRKRVALFAFDAPAGDTASAWLRDAVPMALGTDLMQDIFVDVRVPAIFRDKLREAGIADGYNVPISTKREIAREMHLPWFISGTVERGPEGVTVRALLYETATGRSIGERVVTKRNVLEAVDELSVLLKEDLGLPRSGDVQDLPVESFLSADEQAMRHLVDGQLAVNHQDWAAAETAFERATERDRGFAYAHLALYQTRVFTGNAEKAMPALEAAMQNITRMPERAAAFVKAEYYVMRQQMAKAIGVLEMTVQLYPDDLEAHLQLGQLRLYQDDKRGATQALRKVLELDPAREELKLQIGALEEAQGQWDEALATYRDYVGANPTEISGYIPLGRLQVRRGRHAEARATFERAQLVDPTAAGPVLELAALERATGDLDGSWSRLEDLLRSSRSPEDSARVLESMVNHREFTGQLRDAVRLTEVRLPLVQRTQPPLIVLSQQMNSLDTYVRAGLTPQATATLERVRTGFTPPLDEFWRMGQARMATVTRDTAELREGIDGVRRIMEAFGFNHVRPLLFGAEGALAEERQDWQGALSAYEEVLKADPTAIATYRDISRVYRALNRPDDALKAVGEHLRAVPMSAESNMEAARVKSMKGDIAGAAGHLRAAARVWQSADAGLPALNELRTMMSATGTAAGTR